MPQKPGDESEGLWGKLRQRKVVQWGIAYVAAGWGLLQGLAYVGTAFHWSDQLQRIAIVAFFVGLPIALVVAWYHGDRGHQRVGGREFAILTVLLLIGGGLFWWVGRMPDDPAGDGLARRRRLRAASEPSIAVLPFVNMSDDKGNEYFSDGISEELLNVLVRVDGLGVASRTSSFGYKGSPLGTAAIAQGAQGQSRSRRQRAQVRQSRAHHRAADRRRQRSPPVVGDLRPRADRHLRHPGRRSRTRSSTRCVVSSGPRKPPPR